MVAYGDVLNRIHQPSCNKNNLLSYFVMLLSALDVLTIVFSWYFPFNFSYSKQDIHSGGFFVAVVYPSLLFWTNTYLYQNMKTYSDFKLYNRPRIKLCGIFLMHRGISAITVWIGILISTRLKSRFTGVCKEADYWQHENNEMLSRTGLVRRLKLWRPLELWSQVNKSV